MEKIFQIVKQWRKFYVIMSMKFDHLVIMIIEFYETDTLQQQSCNIALKFCQQNIGKDREGKRRILKSQVNLKNVAESNETRERRGCENFNNNGR